MKKMRKEKGNEMHKNNFHILMRKGEKYNIFSDDEFRRCTFCAN